MRQTFERVGPGVSPSQYLIYIKAVVTFDCKRRHLDWGLKCFLTAVRLRLLSLLGIIPCRPNLPARLAGSIWRKGPLITA